MCVMFQTLPSRQQASGLTTCLLGAAVATSPMTFPLAFGPSCASQKYRQLQKLREACEVMRHSMLGVIAERRGALEARAAAGAGAGEARDVLDMLLQATDDNGVPMTGEGRRGVPRNGRMIMRPPKPALLGMWLDLPENGIAICLHSTPPASTRGPARAAS